MRRKRYYPKPPDTPKGMVWWYSQLVPIELVQTFAARRILYDEDYNWRNDLTYNLKRKRTEKV